MLKLLLAIFDTSIVSSTIVSSQEILFRCRRVFKLATDQDLKQICGVNPKVWRSNNSDDKSHLKYAC